ncbi:MAG: hypothetical protein EB059_11325 [Alphaproteobacteria bacterium]|nr:hypothetical protein [Alphaproteobacteria bacterium]
MKYFWALSLCLVAAPALAAPIKDFSMPVNESLQNAGSAPSKPISGLNNNYRPNRAPAEDDLPAQQNYDKNSSHFMDHYCDPNTRIGIARTSISSCINEKRKAACEEYAAVPSDVRKVLNLEIDCQAVDENANDFSDQMDDEAEDADGFAAQKQAKPKRPADCENSAEQRIALLKKYNNDAYTTHALLFLPDMALKSSAQCVSGR